MLTLEMALSVFAILFGSVNLVIYVRNRDANFRRRLIAFIDQELSKIDLQSRSDDGLKRVTKKLDESILDTKTKLKSMQGQVSRMKADIVSEPKPVKKTTWEDEIIGLANPQKPIVNLPDAGYSIEEYEKALMKPPIR